MFQQEITPQFSLRLAGGEKQMQIKKILWASDGSKESREALRWAELCATRLGASVSALSVIESPDLCTLELPDDVKRKIALIDHRLGRRTDNRLKRLGRVLEQKGIKTETRVVIGIPYQEIIKAAQSHDVDLIAMGKRGLNFWGRMLLGSTATKVLRESHVPILTVRHAAKKPAVKKILVPSSFSPADNVALEWALEFAGKLGASVVLLHIFQAHKSWDNVKGGSMGRLRRVATEKLDAMLETVPAQKRKGVPVITRVKVSSRPWSGIVSFVREEGIDMIVMGTHARKGVPRFFLGSVAERVIREAPCPVINIRP
jgi:nucleotide-binding universal stress UspA family protein